MMAATHVRALGKKSTAQDRCAAVSAQMPDNKLSKLVRAQLLVSGGAWRQKGDVRKERQGGLALSPVFPNPLDVPSPPRFRTGNLAEAAALLETVKDVRHQPAFVGYLVALYNRLEQPEEAERVLTETAAHWKANAKVRIRRQCG